VDVTRTTSSEPLSPEAVQGVLGRVGGTPLIGINGVFAKLEYLNPTGSIKARLASFLIARAEREGLLRPGDTIVEASSGNTGNALSWVAALKGYRMVVVMPNGMTSERVAISRAFGAEVELVGDFHVNPALMRAQALGRHPGWFCPQQFESEWNIEENREWLAPELLAQLPDGRVPDAIVCGIGTGGTLIGVGQAVRALNPDVLLVAVEPDESQTILCGEIGTHPLEGIADGFIPGIVARNLGAVDEVLIVSADDALAEMHGLARRGLFVGPSSGAHLAAARELRATRPELDTIVTFFCDAGEKYLSTHFAPDL
jgi:cysteine synthase A